MSNPYICGSWNKALKNSKKAIACTIAIAKVIIMKSYNIG
jgi:hypothetical protein